MISAAIFGMLIGTFAFGAIADRYGRRPAFQVSVGIFSVLTALSGLSTTLWQLVAIRFAAGIGIGGSIPVETAVLTEFFPANWRARTLAFWGIFLPLGGFVAPLCVAIMPAALGWRGLLFVGGVPAILVLIARRTIPETPQYSSKKGREAEAAAAVAWIANLQSDSPCSQTVFSRPALEALAPAPEKLLFSAAYRGLTVRNWIIYFGSFFSYYGFVLWMPALLGGYRGYGAADIVRFMLGLALAGLGGRLAMTFAVGRVPRRPLLICFALSSVLCLSGFAVATGHVAIMIAGYTAAFFLEGMFGVIIPVVAESYPVDSRATGIGWAGGMGRLGATLAPLAVGALVRIDFLYAILVLAMGSVLVAVAMLYSRLK